MKHYTNTNNPVDFPGSDHHSGDGGYSLGTQEKYTEFVKVRNYNIGKQRIRLLAGQALDQAVPQTWTTLTAYDLNKFTEKFAELIVEEMYCFMVDATSNDGPWPSFKEVKQHFGVEEQEKVAPKPKCSVCGTTENVRYMGGYQPYLCDSVDCIPF